MNDSADEGISARERRFGVTVGMMGLKGGGEKVDAIGIGGGGMEGPKKAVALPLDSVRRKFPCLTDWVRVRAEERLEAFIVRRRRAGEAVELTEEAEEFDDVRERLL